MCLIIYASNRTEYLLYDLLANLIIDAFHTPVNIVTLCMSYFIKWTNSVNILISVIQKVCHFKNIEPNLSMCMRNDEKPYFYKNLLTYILGAI